MLLTTREYYEIIAINFGAQLTSAYKRNAELCLALGEIRLFPKFFTKFSVCHLHEHVVTLFAGGAMLSKVSTTSPNY